MGPTTMADTLDDWLERWPTRKGPATEAEVQRLVDEIEAQRAVIGRLDGGWDHVHRVSTAKGFVWARRGYCLAKDRYEPMTDAERGILHPRCDDGWPCACGIGEPGSDA